jgi:uncharacterized protein DUF397
VLTWKRSSRCEAHNCVEVAFRRASRCQHADCVEVGQTSAAVLVRDSKDPSRVLAFNRAAWSAFISQYR